jgi:hypothetical protein
MRACGELAIVFLALSAVHSPAADLNTPLAEKTTIGSEIRRGERASLSCAKNPLDHNAMNNCLAAVESKARREQANPTPFLLGLYFSSLTMYSEMLEGDKELAGSNDQAAHAIPEDMRDVSRTYANFAKLQKMLGISDGQLVSTVYTEAGRPAALTQLKQWAASPPKP